MQLKELVNHGKLVPDEFIISLLSKRLEAGKEKGESGYILDGFPRTVTQAVSIFSCIFFVGFEAKGRFFGLRKTSLCLVGDTGGSN